MEKVNPAARDPDVANTLLACDIVMAGGVTSGIIYPGAVAMIARRYSFRSIGGTSVGAIAAVGTAAAEYGRRHGRGWAGFDYISKIPRELGDRAPDGGSRLLHLFTPDRAPGRDTRRLLSLAAALITGKGTAMKILALCGAALRSWVVALYVSVAVILGGIVVADHVAREHYFLAFMAGVMTFVFAACAGAVVLGVLLKCRWLPAWRANGYGICTGNASLEFCKSTGVPFEGLTPWLHRVVQNAAGRTDCKSKPLTFGDLWSAPLPDGTCCNTDGDPRKPRSIELAMITSDISRNRAAQLPFLEFPTPLYFDARVLCRYFPKAIVFWMVRKSRRAKRDAKIERRKGVYRLPEPKDMPVVFAARLSLSFPVLLSAVPLLTPDFAVGGGRDRKIPLREVWFSDGGLTSNFPIHFFDSAVPSRPTFCLNLVDYGAELDGSRRETEADGVPDSHVPTQKKAIATSAGSERQAKARPEKILQMDPRHIPAEDEVWRLVSMAEGNEMKIPFTDFGGTKRGASECTDQIEEIGILGFAKALINTARFWGDNQMIVAPGTRDRVVHIALRKDEGGLNINMPAKIIADLHYRGSAAGKLIAARFDPLASDPETGKANRHAFENHRWVRFRNFMAAFEDLSRRFSTARRKSDEAATARGELTIEEMIAGDVPNSISYRPKKESRAYFEQATNNFEKLATAMADAYRTSPDNSFDRPREGSGAPTPRGAAPRPNIRIFLRPVSDMDPRTEVAELPEPPPAGKPT